MWQKIKCLLGFHKWICPCEDGHCKASEGITDDCYNCEFGHELEGCMWCKHCLEVKKNDSVDVYKHCGKVKR